MMSNSRTPEVSVSLEPVLVEFRVGDKGEGVENCQNLLDLLNGCSPMLSSKNLTVLRINKLYCHHFRFKFRYGSGVWYRSGFIHPHCVMDCCHHNWITYNAVEQWRIHHCWHCSSGFCSHNYSCINPSR